jgi:hypothetical protein
LVHQALVGNGGMRRAAPQQVVDLLENFVL